MGQMDNSKEASYPRLEVIAGPQEGAVFLLHQGEQLLGRSRKQVQLCLEDTSVSRVHSKIVYDGDKILIEDLGSRNGTVLNGKRLQKNQEAILSHRDQIKLGLYVLRVALRPLTLDDLQYEEIQEPLQAKESASEELTTPKQNPETVSKEKLEAPDLAPIPTLESALLDEENPPSIVTPLSDLDNERIGNRFVTLFLVICFLSAVVALVYYLHMRGLHQARPVAEEPPKVQIPDTLPPQPSPPLEATSPEQIAPVAAPPHTQEQAMPILPSIPEGAETSQDIVGGSPAKDPQAPPFHRRFPSFIEVESKPFPARILFEDKVLGTTPLKAPVELESQKEYTLTAEFDLRELNDKYQSRLTLKADPQKEVHSLVFNAEIGAIKILKLPRDVHFYLEGFYAYDKYKSHPVKLADIVYGRSIYFPYGHYVIELKEEVPMGDGGSRVLETRYHRELDLNAERREVLLEISDRDLQFFPSKIHSVPSGAAVFLDGKKLGETPFEGDLPLGSHTIKLVREGFFEQPLPLDMRMNVPYEVKLELKTSKVGEHINQAKVLRQNGSYPEAINELVSALKLEASPREKAAIHLLLGENYFMLNNTAESALYFERAKAHSDFYYSALLGLARTHHAMGNKSAALQQVIEILLNKGEGDALVKEARALFKQLSPLKSVLYIASEPKEAIVIVNGREVAQKTPVILSDLALGNYRIEITKRGFQTAQVKQNLKLSDFLPVIVKLNPEKL